MAEEPTSGGGDIPENARCCAFCFTMREYCLLASKSASPTESSDSFSFSSESSPSGSDNVGLLAPEN